jgi:hypothetical protein
MADHIGIEKISVELMRPFTSFFRTRKPRQLPEKRVAMVVTFAVAPAVQDAMLRYRGQLAGYRYPLESVEGSRAIY